MARKLPENEKTAKATLDSILTNLALSYVEEKAHLDSLKKSCDEINKELKDLMQENDIQEVAVGSCKVKYSVSEKETVNELQLIELLTKNHKELVDNLGLIKTKPYVDFNAIEKELYNGNIPEEVMKDIAKCTETKEVVSLRISKEKSK